MKFRVAAGWVAAPRSLRVAARPAGRLAGCALRLAAVAGWSLLDRTVIAPPDLLVQAIIDGRVLCVHGGLSPDLRTLDQVITSTIIIVISIAIITRLSH